MAQRDPWAPVHDNPEPARPPNAHLLAALSRLELKPGGRALDLGCGSGRHLPALAERGLMPVGIDLSSAALARSRKTIPGVSLARSSVAALPFADRAFDLILAWGVLFHLATDPLRAALAEIRRALRSGAPAILHALDPADWRRDPDAGPDHRRQMVRAQDGVTDRFYTPEEIAAMLAPHFEIVSRRLVHTQHDYGLSAEWVIVVTPARSQPL